MADVEVTFGAQLAELMTGIGEAKEALSSFAEIAGIGLSIAGIAEFIQSMADLGEQTERTAAMLGTSTVEAQKLGIEAKLAGGSSEGMAMAMERLQVNLATAGNESSRAGQALKVLGLNAKEVTSLSIPEQINKISDALSKFADGGTKTAAVMALFGRSGAQMIPELDKGSRALEEMQQRAEAAGAIVDEKTTKSLVTLAQTLTLAKAAVTGLGETIVSALSPALIDVATRFTNLISTVHTWVSNFTTDLRAATDAGTVWETFIKTMVSTVQAILEELGARIVALASVMKDFFTLNWDAIKADWAAGGAKVEQAWIDHDARMEALFKKSKDDLLENQRETARGLALGAQNLPTVSAMQVGKGAGGGDALAAANEQIKAIELVYKTATDAAAARLKLGEISQSQETAIILQEIDKREQAELAAVSKEEASGNLSVKQREQAEARKTQIVQQANLDRQKANEKALEVEKAAFDKMGSAISSAFNSQLRSMLDGTETFGAGMEKIFGDMIIKLIEMVVELIAKMAVLLAFEAATGTLPAENPIGSAFSASLGKVFGLAEGTWSVGSGAKFPSYQTGTLSAPGTELALLHSGEMVIPQSPAQQIRDAISGGGTGGGNNVAATFNLSAWDASSVQQWLRGGGAAMIARQVAQVMNNNPTLRPSY